MPDDDVQDSDGQNHRPALGPQLPLGVVVVDDDPTTRMLLVRSFEADRRFWVMATARNGREGVEVVAAQQPDMVLLDVSMPEMDGIAAAARIRAESPGVQIVMCSSDRHRHHEAVDADAELWVDKPIDFTRLNSVLLAAATHRWQSSRPKTPDEPA